MRSYFRFVLRLPYRRLFCLVLAGSQLMPLPEPPDAIHGETAMAFVGFYPAITGTVN
jgi:hypothetical protein